MESDSSRDGDALEPDRPGGVPARNEDDEVLRHLQHHEGRPIRDMRQHANYLEGRVRDVSRELYEDHAESGISDASFLVTQALLHDTMSLLEGIAIGTLHHGSQRITNNLIQAVTEMANAGLPTDWPFFKHTRRILANASQYGLTIDGHNLESTQYTRKVR